MITTFIRPRIILTTVPQRKSFFSSAYYYLPKKRSFSTTTTTGPATPRETPQQKAAKAQQLYEEVQVLLQKQAKREQDYRNRKFGHGFKEFVRENKSEFINIGAAFTCVLLAYQIVGMRKSATFYKEASEETQVKLEEYRQIMRVLSSDSFVESVVGELKQKQNQPQKVDIGDDDDESTVNKGSKLSHDSLIKKKWWWSGLRQQQQKISSEKQEGHEDVNSNIILKEVLKNELLKVIGDKGLTSSEIHDKKIQQLNDSAAVTDSQNETTSKQGLPGEFTQILTDVQKEISSDQKLDVGSNNEKKVVKRSKGFI